MKSFSSSLSITALVFVLSILTCPQSFSQVNLWDDLVGYYPFNGDASDSSGLGNHATIFGATLTDDRFGNPNRAFHFNGTDQYLSGMNDSLPLVLKPGQSAHGCDRKPRMEM